MNFKFTMTVGRLIRNAVKRELRRSAFEADVEIDIKEEKGFFQSDLLVTVSGEDRDKLEMYHASLVEWSKTMQLL